MLLLNIFNILFFLILYYIYYINIKYMYYPYNIIFIMPMTQKIMFLIVNSMILSLFGHYKKDHCFVIRTNKALEFLRILAKHSCNCREKLFIFANEINYVLMAPSLSVNTIQVEIFFFNIFHFVRNNLLFF